ncbi:AMP-binding domain containing protein [Asbolus verrucosus]|uniref:Luciferin 4-monooxygenase n=1 Tax=Asbolus verrucosus TaxID=1661398 RepID=A0A482W6N5_ASBVE|nr:AMP-binding domain containing protein [Asbolus verrucosus]
MVAISSENCIEFFIPIIAAMYIGACVAPISHNYTKNETIHALNISRPNVIFCSQQESSKYIDMKKELNFIEKIIIIDNPKSGGGGIDSINSFIERSLGKSDLLYKFEPDAVDVDNHVSFILYSSGTTGLPKGVMITDRNVLTKFMHGDDPRLLLQVEDRCTFGFLPFFHAYGLFVGLSSIYKKTKIIVLRKFEENLFLRIIEKYKITALPLVPPLAVFLAKSPLVNKYDLSSVVEVGCGAAPLSKEIEELVKKRLKIKNIQQAYGLTEATLALMGMPVGEQRHGSSGKIYPYITCKVRHPETGKSLGPNQVGELCFKGPLIMKGYYGDEQSTRNTFTSDGWLLTGDLGYYDNEEYFYIVGRLKELIKYKGFQVPPAELEKILLTNPEIKDAAVVGLPDEEAGELPLAFIVKNPNFNITEDEVKQFVAKRVSPQKRLRGGVIFVPEIPKNPSGKILRRKLQEQLTKYKSKL